MPIADFPEGLTDLINGGWVRSFPALDINFSDDTALHLSTVPLVIGDTTYEDRLEGVKSIKATRSRSVDRAELVVDNTDLVVGDTLLDDENEDILQNLPAVLSQVYVNIRDNSEIYQIPKMSGIIHTFTEDGSTALNITLISDDYAGGPVAPYSVRKSCVWQYKDGINCTYSGDIPTCDLSFEGANGCVAHFGMDMAKARYGGGAIDLTENTRRAFQPISNPGGPIYGGGGCFIGETPIYVSEADLTITRPIREFREGDPIVGFNRVDLLPVDDMAAKDVLRPQYREWFHLVFSDGATLDVTGTHPFFPEADRRVLVEDFEVGMKFRRLTPSGWRTVRLIAMEPRSSYIPLTFFNVPVSETHDYYANGFPVSNRKDHRVEFPTENY